MKRTLSLLLALLLLLSCAACAGGHGDVASNSNLRVQTDDEIVPVPPTVKTTASRSDLTRTDRVPYVLLTAAEPASPDGAAALTVWLLSSDAAELTALYAARHPELALRFDEDAGLEEYSVSYMPAGAPLLRVGVAAALSDAGLTDYLLPVFEAKYGWELSILPLKPGEAEALLQGGGADLLLLPVGEEALALVDGGLTAGLTPWLWTVD